MNKVKKFGDYKTEAHNWITLSTGEYYPDILPLACELYKPVLVTFGELLKRAYSSTNLLMLIAEIKEQWMRVQTARVFRKYVSPETPVEMLKKKRAASLICEQFGKGFREIPIVQEKFFTRPVPDEALVPFCGNIRTEAKKATISLNDFS